MLDKPLDHLRKHRLRAEDFPFKPLGGRVLLRRVKMDSPILLMEGRDNLVLQVGEVIGLGNRWTEDAKWWPPCPTPHRTDIFKMRDVGKEGKRTVYRYSEAWDDDWKPPDMSGRLPHPPTVFTEMHRSRLSELKAGDLVVFNNARVYDYFTWEGEDLLIYPGNWIHGVVEDTHVADNPDVRRFDREQL